MTDDERRRDEQGPVAPDEAKTLGVDPEGDPNRLESTSLLGYALAKQERFDEAEPLLLETHSKLMETVGLDDRRGRQSAQYLAEMYEAWCQPEKAAEFRMLLEG